MASRIIIIFSILLSGLLCQSQSYLANPKLNTDSMFRALQMQQDEERINTMNKISMAIMYQNPDKAKLYADSALSLASKIEYEEGIASASRMLGWYSFIEGDFVEGLTYSFQAIEIFEKLNKKLIVARLYFEIAYFHYFSKNYEKSIEYYHNALLKFRDLAADGNIPVISEDTISIYLMLSEIYLITDIEHAKSLKYALLALKYREKDNAEIANLLISNFIVGIRYFGFNNDSAKFYFQRSLKYPDESMSIMALKRRSLNMLGWIHYQNGNLDSAIYYFYENFKWFDERGILYWAADACTSLGEIYLEESDVNNAEKHFLKAEYLFEQMLYGDSWYSHDSLEKLVTFGYELVFPLPYTKKKESIWIQGFVLYNGLYNINAGRGNLETALKYHVAYANAKDTLNAIERMMETVDLQARYETEQQERQIENLAQENLLKEFKLRQTSYFLFGLAGLIVLIVILAFIIIRNNKLREEQKNLMLQQKLLRSQMNPHFLFNTLVGIQNFIINQEASLAGKYLSKFSRLVRNILDSSFKDKILLSSEIETLENYLELQKIRFPEKFEYKIEHTESLDPESIYLPPILIQPFVENAIEHGIQHKKGKGQINLRFLAGDHQFICEIEDDGVGREKAGQYMSAQKSEHKSLATGIVMERIKNLNKNLKNKIKFNIIDLRNEDGSAAGTKVVITLPL